MSEKISESERFVFDHLDAPPAGILAVLLHGPEIDRAYETLKNAIDAQKIGTKPDALEQPKL